MSAKKHHRSKPGGKPEPLGVEAYRSLLHPDEFEKLLEAVQGPFPPAIRVNTLKVSEADARRRWPERYGWDAHPVPFCPAGWQIRLSAERPSHTPEYKLGYYYIQDAASMLPVELFDFAGLEQPLILELAAAPGGKTTHLSSRSWDKGVLLANDSSRGRLPALHTALQDWGAMNSLVTALPGEKFGGWFPDQFDLVLLDAPCSMENLSHTGRHSKRVVSEHERLGLAQRQFRLLASAIQAVRLGGQVVYSTCTLAPEEDESVIDHILRRYGDQIRVDEVSAKLPEPAPGLAYLGETDFDPQVTRSLRIWPHLFGSSGFFTARLTKLNSGRQDREDPPRRSFEKYNFTRLNHGGQAELFKRLEDRYGVNLGPVFEGQRSSVWKREDTYYALPDGYLANFSGLPVENPGFWIAEDTHDGLIPSHELVARFGQDFIRGVKRISLEEARQWLGGQDLPPEGGNGFKMGDVVVVIDAWDRVLGRGKVQRERLKNMLPRRLI